MAIAITMSHDFKAISIQGAALILTQGLGDISIFQRVVKEIVTETISKMRFAYCPIKHNQRFLSIELP